ncbi:MAG: hypothetical protein A2087_09770 [Spirochaetes bacterium GWD1_61_31]|nr:MAG: hypothetical protein A2Y37_10255 [Spirochaetes bacterium GWB1_60_80]OHD29037.1 MAG: hypothetical protein A2004_14385 [Spirochaetes bacterium GWC1_61_12]OHD35600.1 MAG: hypothetical protein A2087_09770 [Spirochaetes bacterium GWD1_61_31]OHD44203.1 MAG: hypothetical protein A2Y35_06590 [Spirochaetes bacterium GWE1_60_18]OHD60437.1 MAG: hypothetical protein A2Y32_00935 [Spirochaetes bacterium GWF1_60_12]
MANYAYAKAGCVFTDAGLTAYFDYYDWYQPVTGRQPAESMITPAQRTLVRHAQALLNGQSLPAATPGAPSLIEAFEQRRAAEPTTVLNTAQTPTSQAGRDPDAPPTTQPALPPTP